MSGGIIHQLMHTDCPLDREPTPEETAIAFQYGADDGEWCARHEHAAEPPKHLKHPSMLKAWRAGYDSTRNQ